MIINEIATTLDLKVDEDIIGYNSSDDYKDYTYKPIFALEFIGDET